MAVGFACLLAFVVFPARRIDVRVDGTEMAIVSRERDVHELLDIAGVSSDPGDIAIRAPGEVRVERAIAVIVDVDGQQLEWRTQKLELDDVLKEMGVEVGARDTVFVNGNEEQLGAAVMPVPPNHATAGVAFNAPQISVVRAVPISIVEDGRLTALESSRPTIQVMLNEAGVTLGPNDIVVPPVETQLTAGLQVEIKRAKSVTIRAGSSTNVIYTHKKTLREALVEAGLNIGMDDRVEPSPDASVVNGMTARLVRVAGRTLNERETIERKTVLKPDENLTGSGNRTVQGHDGTLVREYRIVIEDGVEQEKTFLRQYMEPEVQDNVIYYSAETARAIGQPLQTLTIDDTLRMWATWYNPASSGRPASNSAYGVTATGVQVVRGIVAVDPAVIGLGSRLYIPGYGFAVAADTGGGIKGNMVDLGFEDGAKVDWRTGWVDVYLVGP